MKAREPFEKRFKRLYFHVKPLGQNDLQNWSRYLDYELIHGNMVAVIVSPHAQDSITVLFERCLIPCALYEEFWLRYAEWAVSLSLLSDTQHIARGAADALKIVQRCLATFLPQCVSALLLQAALLEEQGQVEACERLLEDVLAKRCPQLLEAAVFYVELLLRHGDRDGAEERMEGMLTEGRRESGLSHRLWNGWKRVRGGVCGQLLLEGAEGRRSRAQRVGG